MPTNVTLPANSTGWVSSGLVVPTGWGFSGTAQGSISPTSAVSWGVVGGLTVYSYPEGRYLIGGTWPQTFTHNPAACDPSLSGTNVAPDNFAQCLLMLVSATNPGSSQAPTGKSIRGDRTFTVAPGDSRIPSGGGTIYLWYNDGPIPAGFTDNGGSFAVSLSLVSPVPVAPVVTAQSGCIGGQAILSWAAVTLATGYKLYTAAMTLIADLGNVLTTTITGLLTGLTYGYYVTAYDAGGEGMPSNTVTVTPCLDPPTLLRWATGGVCEGDQVSLQWNAPEPDGRFVALTYDVYRADVGLVASGIPSTSYVDTTALTGTEYTYTVTAADPWGNQSAPTWPLQVTPCCVCVWTPEDAAPSSTWAAVDAAPASTWTAVGAAPPSVWTPQRSC